jgi:hypothetical protein
VIKVLKVKDASQRTVALFNQEYKRLRVFNTPNILPVLGASVCLPDFILVSQFKNYGSLFSLLHEQQAEVEIEFATLVKIAVDIAKGMEFMHTLTQVYPHFHLNSKHVMVSHFLFKLKGGHLHVFYQLYFELVRLILGFFTRIRVNCLKGYTG